MLHLSIEPSLIELAKSSGLNLSSEFESWIKIRVGNMDNEVNNKEDTEILIAKHRAEIQRLQSQAEQEKEKANEVSAEINTLDYNIDDMVKFKENFDNPEDSRIHAIQFLFKKRYNKTLSILEAKELLINRAKDRGLI